MRDGSQSFIESEEGVVYTKDSFNRVVNMVQIIFDNICPEHVIISNKNGVLTIASISAAINSRINFVVSPYEDTDAEFIAKLEFIKADLIISDFRMEDYSMSLNLNTYDLKIGKEFSEIKSEDYIRKAKALVRAILERFPFKYEVPETPTNYEASIINFHKGLCLHGFKTSMHLMDRVVKGIEAAGSGLRYRKSETVVYIEQLDQLYDIVNGILAPMEKGCRIILHRYKVNKRIREIRTVHGSVYSSSILIEKIVAKELSSLPKIIKNFKLFRAAASIIKLRQLFPQSTVRFILSGRIANQSNLKYLPGRIVSLYTLGEVASYVTGSVVNPSKKLHVGNERQAPFMKSEVRINEISNGVGAISIYTPDMAVSTTDSFFNESFNHKDCGFLFTKDIGYLDNRNNMVIIGRDNMTYTLKGKVYDLKDYVDYALAEEFISNVQIVLTVHNKLRMIVEPNIEWSDKHNYTLEDLYDQIDEFEAKINNQFVDRLTISVKLYSGEKGLNFQTYKVLLRNETL